MNEILILAAAQVGDNKKHPKVDYIELAQKINAEIIDYGSYNQLLVGKAIKNLEKYIHSDIYLGFKSFLINRNHQIILSMSERAGIPFSLLRKMFKHEGKFIFMFTAWSRKQEKLLKIFNFLSPADLIITQAPLLKEHLNKKFNIPLEKLCYLRYTAVDQNFFVPKSNIKPSHIFSLGECRGRDYKVLIQAAADINVPFEIAASGYWYAKERSRISIKRFPSNVRMRGGYNFEEIKDLYARSYFVVIPLYDVIFSAGATAIIESMAMGKAVIVSKSRGILDYVEDGKTGLFVKPGDPDDLREKIQYLLNHPEEARRLGRNAREKIEKEMNIDVYVEKLANIINKELISITESSLKSQVSFEKKSSGIAKQVNLRIGIDGRAISNPRLGGFKTYTKNLVKSLGKIDSKNEYIIYLDRAISLSEFSHFPNVTFKVIGFGFRPFEEQIILPIRIARDRIDVMHFPTNVSPRFYNRPGVVTLHDTLLLEQKRDRTVPERGLWRKIILRHYFSHLIPVAARKARAIITVSQRAEQQIIGRFPRSKDKMRVINNGVDRCFQRFRDQALFSEVMSKYGVKQPFIFGVGSGESNKNIRGLIGAYSKLENQISDKYQLIIILADDFSRKFFLGLVGQLGLANRVLFLHSVPSEDMAELYKAAEVFVLPSFFESFGFPALEAMACGTPVIASDRGALPEVLGDSAMFVNPDNSIEVAEAISQVLSDEALRGKLIKEGLRRAELFSWERCARETLAVYEEIYAKG